MRVDISEARDFLQRGEVVGMPTETVYGLAAMLSDANAIQHIFKLKGRPQDNPLIVHIASEAQLSSLVREVPADFAKLKKFWPGPLTLVLTARTETVPAVVRAGLATVGVRMPAHELTLQLIEQTGPLVAPSANLSGRPSATTAAHVETDFGKNFPVLDGGACPGGVESTIVGYLDGAWRLLRHGAIPVEVLEKALGVPLRLQSVAEKPLSPGQKYRHYAPSCRLWPCVSRAEVSRLALQHGAEAILGFNDSVLPPGLTLVSLGDRNDFAANLKRLYAQLRELDERGFQSVIVDLDFTSTGLGVTLKDRLVKAAQGVA